MEPTPSFCVVIPAYNEEHGIERCVRTLCGVLAAMPGGPGLIVVNDGSTDRTGAILARLAPEYPMVAVVECVANGGYGTAIRHGIARALEGPFEYALFMDSDLTTDPVYIADFVAQMRRGVDVIKASRYVPGGRVEGVPGYRVVISVVGNWLASRMFRLPIRDCTNGFQAIRTDILKRMPLRETGFAVIMEQLYYAKHLARTFAEVPYTLRARPEFVRKSSFYYRPSAFYWYFKYPLRCLLRVRRTNGGFSSGESPDRTPTVYPKVGV